MIKNKKVTKYTLLMSVFALLLCMLMFVGSTFAWFTDSVTSRNNKIQAGNLQITLDLLEQDGSWTSIGKTNKAVFDYDRWEPGYTDVKIFRVYNEGTLALKWIAKVVSNTELSELANVLDVYVKTDISEYPTEPSAISTWEKVGPLSGVVNTVEEIINGNLKEKETAYFGIALRMQDSAGNKYQGMELGLFDLMLLATQYSYETDSFGNDYDSAATYTKPVYFRSLSTALNAINNNSVSEENGAPAKDASVAIEKANKGYRVTLLKALTETQTMQVTSPMILDLNGNTLTFANTSVGLVISPAKDAKVTIDGRTTGSAITIYNTEYTTAIEVKSGNCDIKGGTYQSKSEDADTRAYQNPCIKVSGNGNLNLDSATILAADSQKGTPNAVYIDKDVKATISNCDLTASSPYGLDVNAVYCLGTAQLSKCDIKGYANYTANAQGTDYASRSRGVYNSGKMILNDCYVIGTHSGITSTGTLWIDGGTYESYGHGGIYYGGSNVTSYLKNATVQWCEIPQGYYDDGVAGTNSAGMYIGGRGAKEIVVYADNCHFNAPIHAIVVRGSSGEKNDVLYVSNSTINASAKIRVDVNNKLCIGAGNNFTKKQVKEYGTVEDTNIDYLALIDANTSENDWF